MDQSSHEKNPVYQSEKVTLRSFLFFLVKLFFVIVAVLFFLFDKNGNRRVRRPRIPLKRWHESTFRSIKLGSDARTAMNQMGQYTSIKGQGEVVHVTWVSRSNRYGSVRSYTITIKDSKVFKKSF